MTSRVIWTGHALELHPASGPPIVVDTLHDLCAAMRDNVLPDPAAVAAAGAFGVYLGLRGREFDELALFDQAVDELCDQIRACHASPALVTSLERLRNVSRETRKQGSRTEEMMIIKIRQRLLAEALAMAQEIQ